MGEFPNKATQFSKDYRPEGCNNGRPKGSLSLKTLIRMVWDEEVEDPQTGNKVVKGLLSIKALVDKANKGDVAAFKALAERLEGMPKQEIENTGTAQINIIRPDEKNGHKPQ